MLKNVHPHKTIYFTRYKKNEILKQLEEMNKTLREILNLQIKVLDSTKPKTKEKELLHD